MNREDLGIIVGLLGAFFASWSLFYQIYINYKSDNVFHKLDARYFFESIVYFRRISDSFFGKKLISPRSFVRSAVLTISFFCLLVLLTYLLSNDVIKYKIALTLQSVISFNAPYILFFLLFFAIITDYISVIQTRIFIRASVYTNRLFVLFVLLILDAIVTIFIFILIYPIPVMIIADLYTGLISCDGINYTQGLTVDMYIIKITSLINAMIEHIESYFQLFASDLILISSKSSCDVFFFRDNNFYAEHVISHHISKGYFVMYPLTTLWATTHITSAWLIIYIVTPLAARAVYYEYLFAKKLGKFLNKNPRFLIYIGVIFSSILILLYLTFNT